MNKAAAFIIFFVVIMITVIVVVVNANAVTNRGTAGAQFLKIGVGARAVAMGEAYTALSNDVNGIYWNPAGLSMIQGREVSFSHSSWLEMMNYDSMAFAIPASYGVFGFAVNRLSVGAIDKYSNIGNRVGDEAYNPADTLLTMSYANMFRDICLGVNVKYIESNIDNTKATTVALDAGSLYRFSDGKYAIGFTIQNIGSAMKFVNDSDPLPMTMKLGFSSELIREKNPLIVAIDLSSPSDSAVRAGLGLEYSCGLNESMRISPRLGYKTNDDKLNGLSGLTAGFGFKLDMYMLDYAWVPYGDLGDTHRISGSIKF